MKRWRVVCEARGDAEVITGLLDRLIIEQHSWAESMLEHLRSYLDDAPSPQEYGFVSWPAIKRLAQTHQIKAYRRFGPGAEGASAQQTLKAIRLFLRLQELNPSFEIDALIIAHDTDGEPDWAKGMRNALSFHKTEWPICLAAPHPELEAWILASFEPATPEEKRALEAIKQDLGFDPTEAPWRLSAGRTHRSDGQPIKTSTKVNLKKLAPDEARRRACWADAPLEQLRQRGEAIGLTDFLEAAGPLMNQIGT